MLRIIWIFGMTLTFGNVNLLGNSYFNVTFVVIYSLALALLSKLSKLRKISFGKSSIYLFPFVLVMFLSANMPGFESPFPVYSIPRQLLFGVGIFYIFRLITINLGSVVYLQFNKGVLWGLIISSVLILIGVGVLLRTGNRLSYFSLNPNVLALNYVFGITILLLGKKDQWPRIFQRRFVWLISLLIFIYIAFWTGSRTALLALFLIVGYKFYKAKMTLLTRVTFLVLSIGVIIVGASVFLNSSSFGSRFQTTGNNNIVQEDTRSKIWEMDLVALSNKQAWLFGMGVEEWDHFITVETKSRHIPKAIHNTYLSLVTYSGVLGLTCFIVFLFFYYRRANQKVLSQIYAQPLFLSVLFIFIIFSLFHDIYLSPILWSYGGMLFATPLMLKNFNGNLVRR